MTETGLDPDLEVWGMNVDEETIRDRSTDAVFAEVDEKYNWIDGAYDHYARTIQTALDGYADCVLATDPSPDEFDTYAGVLEARATGEPPINDEQFWRALDDLEERYEQ